VVPGRVYPFLHGKRSYKDHVIYCMLALMIGSNEVKAQVDQNSRAVRYWGRRNHAVTACEVQT
jgi:hypothetical protein